MALAMDTSAGVQHDVMDIDIDMDVDDIGPLVGDEMIEEGEDISQQPRHQDPTGLIPEIYNEDPAKEPQWQKVHIMGVDDMHTNDILAFAKDYFPHADPHIQWIDDTSANIVFANGDEARQAMAAFVVTPESPEAILNDPMTVRRAKGLTSRPSSTLSVRIAQAGDRKKKNAREASRWYLLHPEDDPNERTRREFANSRPGRSENGDYRRRRFDEREHRRRRDQDHNAESEDFSANMYDDAPTTDATADNRGRDLFSRVSKPRRRRSASPSGAYASDSNSDDGRPRRNNAYRSRASPPPYARRDPNPFPRDNAGKELFVSDTSTPKKSGTLQSDLFPNSTPTLFSQSTPNSNSTPGRGNGFLSQSQDHRQSNAAAAKRLKADLLASISNPNSPSQYTYPASPRNGHRRSRAMDAKNAEDLAERFGRKSLSADSTKAVTSRTANSGIELFPTGDGGLNNNGGSGMSIKGSGHNGSGFAIKGTGGFNIKGRAGAEQVKELFPEQYSRDRHDGDSNSSNRGKELFDQPVREKGRRQRAGDLFD